MESFVPDVYIAGTVPYGSQDPLEAAYHAAASSLDDEDIRLIISLENGVVYFLAAHSKDFPLGAQCGTPLANALPNSPGHKGDGKYILTAGTYSLVVEKEGGKLKSFVVKTEKIQSLLKGDNEKVFSVDDMPLLEWEGYRAKRTDEARKAVSMAVRAGVLFFLVLFLMYITLSMAEGYFAGKAAASKRKVEDNLQKVAEQVQSNTLHPVERHLNEIYRISMVVMKAGGNIEVYKAEDGKITWSAKLPKWVSAGDYSELGSNLKTELAGEKIIIKKEKEDK